MNSRTTWAGCVAVCLIAAGARAADKPPAGKPVWSVETKHDVARLSIGAGGKVVYGRDGNKMTGINAADGTVKYETTLAGFEEKGYWGRIDDTTFVYGTGKELVGFDVESGKERWRGSAEGIKTTGWLDRTGRPQACMLAFESGVTIWDLDAGKLLWSAKEPLYDKLNANNWGRDDDPDSGILLFLAKRTVLVGPTGKELWTAADTGNVRRGGEDVVYTAMQAYGRLLLVYLSKQVVLLNNATGEVLASQAFPTPEAAADVEAFKISGENAPLIMSLGGRLVIADPKEGKLIAKSAENSIVGQMASAVTVGSDGLVAMTAIRGGEKTPDVGMHLYRVALPSGDVKWHAYNGGTVDTRQVMQNVVGEKINGPFYLDQAKGVLLATAEKGARLYDWETGKERWSLDKELPYSYRVMVVMGGNSFAVIRSMMQNRFYVTTNPTPVEADGVVYVASDDEVFAVDAATGKLKWTSQSKNLSLIADMKLSGGSLILKQGLYRDANDFGAPTTIVTRFGAPTLVEEPEVYIEEDPYGFVALDVATGKEQWKCLDFEARDAAYSRGMPKDAAICGGGGGGGGKAEKVKSCKPSKLGIGDILTVFPSSAGPVYLGKSGIAAQAEGACTAAWSVDGSIKKAAKIYTIEPLTEDKATAYVQYGDPGVAVAHYGNEVTVVDVGAGKVVFAAGKADVVKVVPEAKLLFAADGNTMSMYKIP